MSQRHLQVTVLGPPHSGKSSFVLSCLKGRPIDLDRPTRTAGASSSSSKLAAVLPPITLTGHVLRYPASLTLVDTRSIPVSSSDGAGERRKKTDLVLLCLAQEGTCTVEEVKRYLDALKSGYPGSKWMIRLPRDLAEAAVAVLTRDLLALDPDILAVHAGQTAFQSILDSIQSGLLYPVRPVYQRTARTLTHEARAALTRLFYLHLWTDHLAELSKLLGAEPLDALPALCQHVEEMAGRSDLECLWTTLTTFGYHVSSSGDLVISYPEAASPSGPCHLSRRALDFLARLERGIRETADGADQPLVALVTACRPLCERRDGRRLDDVLGTVQRTSLDIDWSGFWSLYARIHPCSARRIFYALGYTYLQAEAIDSVFDIGRWSAPFMLQIEEDATVADASPGRWSYNFQQTSARLLSLVILARRGPAKRRPLGAAVSDGTTAVDAEVKDDTDDDDAELFPDAILKIDPVAVPPPEPSHHDEHECLDSLSTPAFNVRRSKEVTRLSYHAQDRLFILPDTDDGLPPDLLDLVVCALSRHRSRPSLAALSRARALLTRPLSPLTMLLPTMVVLGAALLLRTGVPAR